MAKTGHPNLNLRYHAPWRGITKVWSLQMNHSGIALSTDQALAFAQAVHNDVISQYFSVHATNQFLSGYSYYDGTNSAATTEADYEDAASSITAGFNGVADYGGAYGTGTDLAPAGLESCCVLLAPLGLNKTGKPFFMRKFIHGCPAPEAGTDSFGFASGPHPAVKLGDGSLPGTRVLCTDKGDQGSWDAQSYVGNHQLFRKYVPSKAKAALDYLRGTGAIDIPPLTD